MIQRGNSGIPQNHKASNYLDDSDSGERPVFYLDREHQRPSYAKGQENFSTDSVFDYQPTADYTQGIEPDLPYESEYNPHPSVWSQQAMDMTPEYNKATSANLLHPEYSHKWHSPGFRQPQSHHHETESIYQRFKHSVLDRLPGRMKMANQCPNTKLEEFHDHEPKVKKAIATDEDILDAIVKQLPKTKVKKVTKKKPCTRLASASDQELDNEPIGKYWRRDPLESTSTPPTSYEVSFNYLLSYCKLLRRKKTLRIVISQFVYILAMLCCKCIKFFTV